MITNFKIYENERVSDFKMIFKSKDFGKLLKFSNFFIIISNFSVSTIKQF